MTEESRVVPKRRFKEFQNTEGWEQRKLEEMTESFEYGLNVSATVFDGINKYIRITDIDDDSRLFNQNGLMSPNFDSSKANSYLLKNGDVLFARTGASVGKTYRYQESDGKVYYAGFLIRARINQNFDSEFVFQNTLTKKYDNYIRITSQRSGQPGVNAQEYANYELMVPTLGEQQEIGAFFKSFDYLITFHQRKLEKISALKSAYLSELFPAEGEKKPKRRFAGFTDDWEERRLTDVAELFSGLTYSPNDVITEGGTLVLRSSNVKDGEIINADNVYVKSNVVNVDNVQEGDVIVVVRNGSRSLIGKHAQVKIKMENTVIGAFMTGMRSLNPSFINALLSAPIFKKEVEKNLGATINQITNSMFQNMYFMFPNEEEQIKIGNYFGELDHLMALQQRKLEKLQNLKKAYLNEMFV